MSSFLSHVVCAVLLWSASGAALQGTLRQKAVHDALLASQAGGSVRLTPLLRQGLVEEARAAARVTLPSKYLVPGSGASNITLYAGLFQVGEPDASCGTKELFAMYAPPQKPTKPISQAGTLMWLQGGPGASGTFGFFAETGPLVVAPDSTMLEPREWSWSLHQGGLWVDQPLGTGLSIIDSESCLTNTSAEAAHDLINLLEQWAELFSEAASGPFRIAGESYGGTYAPATAFALMHADRTKHPRAAALFDNLDAIMVGDPWAVPTAQLPVYGALLHGLSVADEEQAAVVDAIMARAFSNVTSGTLEGRLEAFRLWDSVWGDYNPTGFTSLFEKFSGCTDTLNMLRCQYPADLSAYGPILADPEVLRALHADRGVKSGANSSLVYRQYAEVSGDFMVGVKKEMEALLAAGKRMLVYHGAVDGICGAVTGNALVRSLRWDKAGSFADAPRQPWKVDTSDTSTAGWVVESSDTNLAWVVVRNGGHLLPHDQPRAAWAMMNRFTSGQPILEE